MTTSEILASIRHLPDDAQVTVTVAKGDLVRALEDRDDNPDRMVTTRWCSETLGMSKQWWADACRAGRIHSAFQEEEGTPWHLRAGEARRHLEDHRREVRRERRRRGPRQARGAS